MKVLFITIVCLYAVGGVVSRSTRSTRRHGGGGAEIPENCQAVKPFFESKNISVDFTAITKTDIAESKFTFKF